MSDILDKKKTILITAGGTREAIDEVRFITNVSTGSLGSLAGDQALAAGYRIVYLAGMSAQAPLLLSQDKYKERGEIIRFSSTGDLLDKVRDILKTRIIDIVIHSAAIADYTPVKQAGKIKSGMKELIIQCVPTPKVVKEFKKIVPSIFLVMFKLEVNQTEEELIESGYLRLKENDADLVVANDLSQIKNGEHIGYLISPAKQIEMAIGKNAIAAAIIKYIENQAKIWK